MLLCYTEPSTFTTLSTALAASKDSTYEELTTILNKRFPGTEYRQRLELRLRTMKLTRLKVNIFSTDLKNDVKEFLKLTQSDDEATEAIAVNHVVAKLDGDI